MYVDDGEVVYGFNPINWRVNSITVVGEGKFLDGKYSIGDNAEEAIDYYSEKYKMPYLGDVMNEPSDNIIKLSDHYTIHDFIPWIAKASQLTGIFWY